MKALFFFNEPFPKLYLEADNEFYTRHNYTIGSVPKGNITPYYDKCLVFSKLSLYE